MQLRPCAIAVGGVDQRGEEQDPAEWNHEEDARIVWRRGDISAEHVDRRSQAEGDHKNGEAEAKEAKGAMDADLTCSDERGLNE